MRLIDADALLNRIKESHIEGVWFIELLIEDAKTIEFPKQSIWIHDGPSFPGGTDWFHCSSCSHKEAGIYVKYPYCAMCGSKMEGVVESDASN